MWLTAAALLFIWTQYLSRDILTTKVAKGPRRLDDGQGIESEKNLFFLRALRVLRGQICGSVPNRSSTRFAILDPPSSVSVLVAA